MAQNLFDKVTRLVLTKRVDGRVTIEELSLGEEAADKYITSIFGTQIKRTGRRFKGEVLDADEAGHVEKIILSSYVSKKH